MSIFVTISIFNEFRFLNYFSNHIYIYVYIYMSFFVTVSICNEFRFSNPCVNGGIWRTHTQGA